MKQIIIWGNGYYGRQCLQYINQNVCEVKGIIETHPQNSMYDGIEISSPTILNTIEYDYLIIANSYVEEIKELLEKLNKNDNRIVVWIDMIKNPFLHRNILLTIVRDDLW